VFRRLRAALAPKSFSGRPSWSWLLFSAPVRSGSSPIAFHGLRRANRVSGFAGPLPLHRPPSRRPLPPDLPLHVSAQRVRRASATRAPPSSILFRPCGFSPLRRLPPPRAIRAPSRSSMESRHAQRSRACCIPLPILGFTAFPAPSARIGSRRIDPSRRSRSPQRDPRANAWALHPSKERSSLPLPTDTLAPSLGILPSEVPRVADLP